MLFERAEADSLNYLERQVFFKSRILNYGEEDRLSGVSSCAKYLAWLFIVVYAVGLSFYVCLFAVKAGRATSVQWMISFWVAFVEVNKGINVLSVLPSTYCRTKRRCTFVRSMSCRWCTFTRSSLSVCKRTVTYTKYNTSCVEPSKLLPLFTHSAFTLLYASNSSSTRMSYF